MRKAAVALGVVVLFAGVSLALSGRSYGQNSTDQTNQAGSADVAALVKNLSHEDYLLRQKSSEQLLEIGSASIGPLKEAAKSFDEELRYRVNDLLKELVANEVKQRVERFLESPEDSAENFGFEDWPAFSQVVGDTENARKLLVAIFTGEDGVVGRTGSIVDVSNTREAMADEPVFGSRYIAATVEAYCAEMFRRLRLNPPKISPLAATDRDRSLVQHFTGSAFERSFLTRLPVPIVEKSEFREEFSAVLTAWLNHELKGSPLTLTKIQIISAYRLVDFEAVLLGAIGQADYLHKIEALEAIVQIHQPAGDDDGSSAAETSGADAAINALKPLIRSSETVLMLPQAATKGAVAVTVGDLAFQLILSIEEKTPKDFGLLPANGRMSFSNEVIYCFPNRQEAGQGINKWASLVR